MQLYGSNVLATPLNAPACISKYVRSRDGAYFDNQLSEFIFRSILALQLFSVGL